MMKQNKTCYSYKIFAIIGFMLAILFIGVPSVMAKGQDININPFTKDFSGDSYSVPGVFFIHTATASNSIDDYSLIDHPLLNFHPNAIMLVTQNQSPDAFGGSLNNHPIGVWYNTSQQKWAVFNEDIAAITELSAFNVMIPDSSTTAFVHTAESGNIFINSTFIDNPLTNGNPNAIVLVTQNWNPSGATGVFNNHNIGVWYNATNNKWAVFNEDTALMPEGASFNVLVAPSGTDAFVHTSTLANTQTVLTRIDNPLTNFNPYAILLSTPNYNPGGGAGSYYNYPPSVLFSLDKWAISNQIGLEMPVGVSFNIIVKDNRVFLPVIMR